MKSFTLILMTMLLGIMAYGQPTSGLLDFGTSNSAVFQNYTRITDRTSNNNFRWTNRNDLSSADRGQTSGVNALNRDFIFSRRSRTFEARVRNGAYNVVITFGDRNGRHDRMRVRAETGPNAVTRSNITTNARQFKNVIFNVQVRDGRLTLRFFDDGGSDPNWVVNRVKFERLFPLKETTDSDITVYPNPVNDVLNIEFTRPVSSVGTLQIHDLSGRAVGREHIVAADADFAQVNVSNLAAGTYVAKILFEDGTQSVQSFIKVGR